MDATIPPTGSDRNRSRTQAERLPNLGPDTLVALERLDAKVRAGTYVPSTFAAARARLAEIRASRQDAP